MSFHVGSPMHERREPYTGIAPGSGVFRRGTRLRPSLSFPAHYDGTVPALKITGPGDQPRGRPPFRPSKSLRGRAVPGWSAPR